jgi:hypothetical protein
MSPLYLPLCRGSPQRPAFGLLRSSGEEAFGVYGEHHPHVAAGVLPLHDAHRPAYALGLHSHPEEGGPFAHLHGDLYHPSPPSRRTLCGVSGRELGRVAFGVMDGERERSSHPNPSSWTAYRRRRRQQINECRFFVWAPTTISQASMLHGRRVAIGLSDYFQAVIGARAIALPAPVGVVFFSGSVNPQIRSLPWPHPSI